MTREAAPAERAATRGRPASLWRPRAPTRLALWLAVKRISFPPHSIRPHTSRRHTFGLRPTVGSPVLHADAQSIIFVAGNAVVVQDRQTRRQRHLPGSPESGGITALALSPSRTLLAVAELSSGVGQSARAVVWDLPAGRRRKLLICSDAGVRSFASLSFSPDERWLLAQADGAPRRAVLFQWEKGRVAGTLRVPAPNDGGVTDVSFAPRIASTEPGAFSVIPTASAVGPACRADLAVRDGALTTGTWDGSPDDDATNGTAEFPRGSIESLGVVGALSGQTWVPDSPPEALGALPMPAPAEGEAGPAPLLVIGTDRGELAVLRDGVVVQRLAIDGGDGGGAAASGAPGDAGAELPVVGLAATASGGFVAAGARGQVLVAKRLPQVVLSLAGGRRVPDPDAPLFAVVALERCPYLSDSARLTGLSVSPDDAAVAMCSDDLRIYEMRLPRALAATAMADSPEGKGVAAADAASAVDSEAAGPSSHGEDDAGVDDGLTSPVSLWMELSPPLHCGPVVGLGTCVRRPLVAACSSPPGGGCEVRLWNWESGLCELARDFPEEASSVALHPSGYMLLVGFADKLRLMTVAMDGLRPVADFTIKGCRDCRFSHGGHLIAAANGTTIQIIETYTGASVATLRGHHGKITSLLWSTHDNRLVSAGADGAVYAWTSVDWSRDKNCESVLKGCQYRALAATPDGRRVVAVGSDNKVKEVDPEGAFAHLVDLDDAPTAVALPDGGRHLFVGTESGRIRALRWPLTGEFQEPDAAPHGGAVTRMCLADEGRILIASGADGVVSIHDVRQGFDAGAGGGAPGPAALTGGGLLGSRGASVGASGGSGAAAAAAAAAGTQAGPVWAEEVLVTRGDLEDQRRQASELEQKLADNALSHEYARKLKENHANERAKALTQRYTSELEANRETFERALQARNESEMAHEAELKEADEGHQMRMAALDSRFQARIMQEVERWQALQADRQALERGWREAQATTLAEHERVVRELTERFEAELDEERAAIDRLKQEREEMRREQAEAERQMLEDFDHEIENVRSAQEAELAAERDLGLRLKGENGIMRKKFQQRQKEIQDKLEEKAEIERKLRDIEATIAATTRDNLAAKSEIDGRDAVIVVSEKRAYDVSKSNQELEKHRFVLDFKIKDLKRQIEPREAEIEAIRSRIKGMDGDLERYHRGNAALEVHLGVLQREAEEAQAEALRGRAALRERGLKLRRVQHDLNEVVGFIQEPRRLREYVRDLYRRHVGSAHVERARLDADVRDEHARQTSYLKGATDRLKNELSAQAGRAARDMRAGVADNQQLIRELAELRRQVKELRAERARAAAEGRALASSTGGRRGDGRGGKPALDTGLRRGPDPARVEEEEAERVALAARRAEVAAQTREARRMVALLEAEMNRLARPDSGMAARPGSARPTVPKMA